LSARREKSPSSLWRDQYDINPYSPDDILAILKGLQYIYTDDDTREKVFGTLEKTLGPTIQDTDRTSRHRALRKFFVLATSKPGLKQ